MVSLAVLGDEALDWQPTSFGYARWGCRLLLEFPIVKLRAIPQAVLEATVNPLVTLTLLHRDAQETRRRPRERLQRKVARYRALLGQGYQAEDVRVLLRLMDHVLRLTPELASEARQAMRQVEEEVFGMERFLSDIEELALAEGKLEGLAEGQRALVLRQLERKLGPLPAAEQARVTALSPEQLLALGDALLDFASLGELQAWLDAQPPAA